MVQKNYSVIEEYAFQTDWWKSLDSFARCLLSDDDVASVVDFAKNQASADYDETFDPGEVAEDDAEVLIVMEVPVHQILETHFSSKLNSSLSKAKASASMLQRRLSTGFNRATRIMEELEEATGIITPAEGTKPPESFSSASGRACGWYWKWR